MKTIVSILSKQLIPNVLFIKQMAAVGDRHIFLSSESMEQEEKSKVLAGTLEISSTDYKILVLDPNRPEVISRQLDGFDWPQNTHYIVNITGGTKMMSQVCYQFFTEKMSYISEIYYWPITGAPLQMIFPEIRDISFKNSIELDLKTYLAAYGYEFMANYDLSYKINRANELYDLIVKFGDSGAVKYITNAQNPKYIKSDKNYLIGGWFEEWFYHLIKTELKLKDHYIAYNLKLRSRLSNRKSESDNEIDIAFVYKNTLYIIECKVYTTKQLDGKKITDAIYKLSSIRQSMGLQATAFVAIMSDFGKSSERKETIHYLSKMAQIKRVFSLEDMSQKQKFIQEIKNIVSYD